MQLLQNRGVQATVVEYLEKPLSVHQLREVMQSLDVQHPRDMMRPNEIAKIEDNAAKAINVDEDSVDSLLDAIVKHPILLQRPILVNASTKKAVIGRPPSNIEQLLDY